MHGVNESNIILSEMINSGLFQIVHQSPGTAIIKVN